MKKLVSLFLSLILCTNCLCLFSSAIDASSNSPTEVLISSSRFNLPDGGYVIEEIKEIYTNYSTRATNTKTGSKTSTRYTESGTAIFTVQVTGTFCYTGASSWATSSSATVYTHLAGASTVSKSSSYSGATASATGTVKYLGINLTRTANLTCSKSGSLS